MNDCLDKVNDSWGKVKINGFIRKKKTPDSIKPDVLFWWGMVDSNHRRHSQQIYSLSPLATREIPHMKLEKRLELVDGLEPPTC